MFEMIDDKLAILAVVAMAGVVIHAHFIRKLMNERLDWISQNYTLHKQARETRKG